MTEPQITVILDLADAQCLYAALGAALNPSPATQGASTMDSTISGDPFAPEPQIGQTPEIAAAQEASAQELAPPAPDGETAGQVNPDVFPGAPEAQETSEASEPAAVSPEPTPAADQSDPAATEPTPVAPDPAPEAPAEPDSSSSDPSEPVPPLPYGQNPGDLAPDGSVVPTPEPAPVDPAAPPVQ